MDSENILYSTKRFIDGLSQTYGSGSLIIDACIVIISFIVLCAVLYWIVSFAVESGNSPRAIGQPFPIAGKLEKIERSLNAFRSESIRSLEILHNDIEQIKGALGASSAKTAHVPGENSEKESTGPKEEQQATPSEPQEPPAESLSLRLVKTRKGLFERLKSVFSGGAKIDEEKIAELEALLIQSDLGVKTVQSLIGQVKEDLAAGVPLDEETFKGLLKIRILNILEKDAPFDAAIHPAKQTDGPMVVMIVGVNGSGKTTSCAKLARSWKSSGAKVLLVAADTFRAAAVQQLVEWGNRLEVPVVSGPENAKPSTVVFDAMEKAKSGDFDVVLIDTAGRLHTKSNLMQELEGIKNIISRHQPDAPHETILVVDGTTGQNAITQAKEFNDAAKLSGLIITKLDGTPKGGVVVAIKDELGIPVRYIGVGETPKDLRPFIARDFVEALFEE